MGRQADLAKVHREVALFLVVPLPSTTGSQSSETQKVPSSVASGVKELLFFRTKSLQELGTSDG